MKPEISRPASSNLLFSVPFAELLTLMSPVWKLMVRSALVWIPPMSPTRTSSMNTQTSSSPANSKVMGLSAFVLPSFGCTKRDDMERPK